MFRRYGKREGVGDLLADGTRPAAERMGKDAADMLAEYYRLRGWDANGAPTKARLKALRVL